MDYTLRMLESLFVHHTNTDMEVFVVENGSGDSTQELERRFPQVRLIQSEQNLGFAGGCNLALKEAKGDVLILVNPDILFEDNALEQIEAKMLTHVEVGIGGISLKNLDGSQQACVWAFPKPCDQILLLLKLNHIFPNLPPLKNWLMKDFDYTQSADVDQVMGAFFCIRREVLEEIGFLDDGFFIWYEEVDYCVRAKNANWRVRYFSDLHAKHKKGASFDQVATIKKQAMLRRSIRRFMFKHYGFIGGMLFVLGEPIFWVMSVLTSIIKPR